MNNARFEGMTDTDLLNCILSSPSNARKLKAIEEIISMKQQTYRAAYRKLFNLGNA